MLVNPRHGRCRVCKSRLYIVEADDATMTVECEDNGHCYAVDPDVFGDESLLYHLQLMMEREGLVD